MDLHASLASVLNEALEKNPQQVSALLSESVQSVAESSRTMNVLQEASDQIFALTEAVRSTLALHTEAMASASVLMAEASEQTRAAVHGFFAESTATFEESASPLDQSASASADEAASLAGVLVNEANVLANLFVTHA